ncbi:MAG: ATP-dependent DNA helicase RecG, partial [Gammaproteobacteria bacterium]|nr:ATP-dependent DNA helicase RecG [Gammaproteobacteria bacterium]
MNLNQIACHQLKGVGPKLEAALHKLGVFSVQDLLFHLPLRYEDHTHLTPLRFLRSGIRAVVEGTIVQREDVYRGKTRFFCRLSDEHGFLGLRFFHIVKFQKDLLKLDAAIRCYGEVRFGSSGLEMIHPEFHVLDPEHPLPLEDSLTPVYPTTEGLHQRNLRKIILQALLQLERSEVTEFMPFDVLHRFQFPSLKQALLFLHRPPPDVKKNELFHWEHPCQVRLIFEELLAHHLSLLRLRKEAEVLQAPVLKEDRDLIRRFIQRLPFQLTGAQQRVVQEIEKDVAKAQPMLRLLQGDVGSGKTVVAAIAALYAIGQHKQVALMAPTELLAEQHLKSFRKWFEALDLRVVWLSGQQKAAERAAALEHVALGTADIVVGTHALFQSEVRFKHLALVIVDEQHRFGVHQRLALWEKGLHDGLHPHQLIMTATPIPRTLAMVAYADLDQSVIDELPAGRKPVKTAVISNQRRMAVISRIHEACRNKRQAYWVCTLIEESEALQCQAAEQTMRNLRDVLPELRIGLLHGRMKSDAKEVEMERFKSGEIDLLVATTVIEVGVDVPNASLMVIENAERLGLAQLHQLRGRVGRGEKESHCILMFQYPLSELARERLSIMRSTNDGFLIAQKDLELRGPGEVLGTKQAGMIQMRVADILRDAQWLPEVHKAAQIML